MTTATTVPTDPGSRIATVPRALIAIVIIVVSTFSVAQLFKFTFGIKFEYMKLLDTLIQKYEVVLTLAAQYVEPRIKEFVDRWLQLHITFHPVWRHVFVIMFACYIFRDARNYWKLNYKAGAISRIVGGFLFALAASLVVGILSNLDLPYSAFLGITLFLICFFILADFVTGIASTRNESNADLSQKRWLLYVAAVLALVAMGSALISPPQTVIIQFLITALPISVLYLYYLFAHATDTFFHRSAISGYLQAADQGAFNFFFSRARRWTAVYSVGILIAGVTFLILRVDAPNSGLRLLVFLLVGLGLFFLYRAWRTANVSFWQFILALFGLGNREVAGNLALGRAMLLPFFVAGVILAIDFFLFVRPI